MQDLTSKNEIHIKLDTEEMTPTQVRIVRAIHSLMSGLLTAEDESEYFELSAELMKRSAELIKHSSFNEKHKHINYGEQAVEYAVDFLNERLDNSIPGNVDN
jgi:hypothetical protein